MRPAAPITAIRRMLCSCPIAYKSPLQIAEEALHTFKPAIGLGRMRVVTFERRTEFFEQFALTATQVDRGFHRHTTHQVACTATTYRRHTLATQAELLAGLRAFRDFQLD